MIGFIWAVLAIVSLFLYSYYKQYFHFLMSSHVMVMVLIITVIVAIGLFIVSKDLRTKTLFQVNRAGTYFISFLFCYSVVFVTLGSVNRGLDFSPEKKYVCQVVKKQYRQQKISLESHYLTLTNELLSQEKIEISVSAQEFNKIQEGQNVGVHIRNGLFGWKWISKISY